jgi:hypothetical protein
MTDRTPHHPNPPVPTAPLLLAAAMAFGAVALPAAAPDSMPPCPARLLRALQPVVPGADTRFARTVLVEGTTVTIPGVCLPVEARVRRTARGSTLIRASWESCGGLVGPVRLLARLDATCERLRGMFSARGMSVRTSVGAGALHPTGPPTSGCCDGNSYEPGELLVVFESGVSRAGVDEMAGANGLTVIGLVDERFNAYLFGVEPGEEVAWRFVLAQTPGVLSADVNVSACPPESPQCTCCEAGAVCPNLPPC